MSAHVWRAGPDEAEIVAGLLVEFRDHLGRDWPSANAFLAGVERLIESPETEYLLGAVDEDSPPTGVAQLRYRHALWTAAEDCWLEDLFVRKDARRRGLGDALVRGALARAHKRGCRRVELDADEDNVAALRVYERHGFRSGADEGARDLMMRRRLPE